jgi:hypothetical protein
MAHQDDDKIHKIERAMAENYRTRSEFPFGALDVTQAVMRDIRRATGGKEWWTPSVVLDQLVWRTATITAAVVLMVTVITVGLFRPQVGENPGVLAEEFESVPLFGD